MTGYPPTQAWVSGLVGLLRTATAGGAPASTVFIDYKTEKVEWRWDAALGKYRRWMDFKEHLDANTEEQLSLIHIS